MNISDEKAMELAQDILYEQRRCSDCENPVNNSDEQDREACDETGLCKACLDTYLFGDD